MDGMVSTVNAMRSAPVDTLLRDHYQEALYKEDLQQSAGGVQTRLLTVRGLILALDSGI
jgi:hypothetical protein